MVHRDLLIRALLGAPCLALAYWLFLRAGGGYMGVLFVFPCLAAFAAIISPSLTSSMASFWGGIYMPERNEGPKPYVSRARTLRARGLPEEALEEYEEQIAAYPTVVELWIAVLEIAWLELRDRERASELHRRGLRCLKQPEDRERLHRVHLRLADRHPDAEE